MLMYQADKLELITSPRIRRGIDIAALDRQGLDLFVMALHDRLYLE